MAQETEQQTAWPGTPCAHQLWLPKGPAGAVVFASPHSGRDYPAALLAETPLDARAIRSSEDAFVDELIAEAPGFGVPVLAARVPRAYVDLNRAADELDPALIEGLGRPPLTPRIAAGLGVIPRVVSGGRAIYRRRLSRAEAQARIDQFWTPYHAALADLLDRARARHGAAFLIDWHSMPHEALTNTGRGTSQPPEVVLGDRFGAAAAPWVSDHIEAAFREAGFRVARNAPFAGVYVAETYGRPAEGLHAIQIEIDRALYMNEAQVLRAPGFASLQRRLSGVMARIALLGAAEHQALAAE